MKKILFILAVFIFSFSKGFAQSIENVKFIQGGSKIMVTYNLIDKDDSRTYEVTLEISKDGGITFQSLAKTLSGDFGKNVKPGDTKRITWDVLKDVAELQGNNFVFKIIAQPNESESRNMDESSQPSSGGISPYIWIGGGALILGGAAILLLSKKGESGSSSPDLPDTGSIPWPPK
jgi:hypothetical protein